MHVATVLYSYKSIQPLTFDEVLSNSCCLPLYCLIIAIQ